MAKKDRQKRAARKARQQKRADLEAAHNASGYVEKQPESKGTVLKKKDSSSSKAKNSKDAKKKKGRIRGYFSDVRTEMHQVVWPSKSELRNYSVAVIAMLIVFGVCVWLVDTGFVQGLVALTSLKG